MTNIDVGDAGVKAPKSSDTGAQGRVDRRWAKIAEKYIRLRKIT